MAAIFRAFRLLVSCFCSAALLWPSVVSANDTTRQVQEELRKRRLYNGNIDGQHSPELGIALKRYQERKSFPASGVADTQTLRALGIVESTATPPAESANPAAAISSITGNINLAPPSREELHEFMRRYLAALESDDVSDELALCAPHVDYFAHGIVPKTNVGDELIAHDNLWPQRRVHNGRRYHDDEAR